MSTLSTLRILSLLSRSNGMQYSKEDAIKLNWFLLILWISDPDPFFNNKNITKNKQILISECKLNLIVYIASCSNYLKM